MSTQPILAFDCATVGASIALMSGGNTSTRRIGQTAQAAQLLPAIDGLMREAGVTYSELACIISTVGPGSFTGVRIGLAALHGLVLVNKTPIKMLTTLEAMAWAVAQKPNAPAAFVVALRAGKGEVYAQRFDLLPSTPSNVTPAQAGVPLNVTANLTRDSRLRGNDAAVSVPQANGDVTLRPETFTDWGAPCFGNQLAPDDVHFIDGPDATTLCAIAPHLALTPLAEALPLYIRPPDAIIGAPLPWLTTN